MMDWDALIAEAQLFFLVFVRIMALLHTAPLTSSSAIPMPAKGALGFFSALIFYHTVGTVYGALPPFGLGYAFVLIAEVMLGIIMGLFLQIVFAVFQTAGQLFSLQMGYGAAQVYDLMAQEEVPLLGQFLNLMGLAVFISINGVQKMFLQGLTASFRVMKGTDFMRAGAYLQEAFIQAIGGLFEQSLILGFPILGTLVLVSVTMGLLSRASPQMNLLMVGFPIQIGTGFIIIYMTLPFIAEKMSALVDMGFFMISDYLRNTGEALR